MYKKLLAAVLLVFANAYGEWKPTGNVSDARAGFMGCMLTDGRMMIWGGSITTTTSEIFDPATGNWTTGTVPHASSHSMGIHLPNGKVLYTGYSSGQIYIYDPFTNSWTGAASFGTWPYRTCANLLRDGKVLVMAFDYTNLTKCVLYDYATNSITPTGNTIQDHAHGPGEVLLPSGDVLFAGGAGMGGTTATEIYNPTSGTWTQVGNMNIARWGHVGILIPPPWNKVLVAAHYSSSISQTELFDIGSGTWSYTAGSLNNPDRGTPCLIMLPSGKPILIGGGVGNPPPLQAEIFDPTSQTWTLTGPMNSGRLHFTSVILHTGKVLAISGAASVITSNTPTCDIYDPSEPIWATKTPLNHSRSAHTATLLPIIHTTNCSTNVLIAGGENSSGTLQACELYNYIDESVSLTGDLNTARAYHTANLLSSGRVLAAGGKGSGGELNSCELYDLTTETWSFTGDMGEARFDHSATLLRDGRVLVTGGYSTGYLSSCEVYDAGAWAGTAPLATPRASHTVVLLLDGRVLVIGGENASGVLNTCEIWNGTNWAPAANLATGRSLHTAVLLQSGKVLVIGGKGATNNALTSCEIYNPTTNTWAQEAPLNNARYLHTTTLTYSGLILVSCGFNGTNYLSACEIYDPAIKPTMGGEWKTIAQLATPRAYHTSCVIPDEKPYVLTIGGENSSGYINSVEEYDQGLGYISDWQSMITNYPAVTQVATPMNIEGTLFRGVSEADGGNHAHIASSDHPITALLRVGGGNFQGNGGGEVLLMPLSSYWDETHTTVQPPSDAPQGYYVLWSIVNGIPCKWYKECAPGVEESSVWQGFSLAKVHPNPSTGTIYIEFSAKYTGSAVIKIYDCSGRMFRKEVIECASPGVKEVRLDIKDLSKGIYFYSIDSTIPISKVSKGKFIVL